MAIKSTVRRTFNEFWNHLYKCSTTNPNLSVADALRYVLSDIYNIPDEAIDKALIPNTRNVESIIIHLVWERIYKELGNNPTIATEENIILVINVLHDCWQKLTEGTEFEYLKDFYNTSYIQNGSRRIEKEQDGEDSLSVTREIYNSLSPEEKVNLEQEFIRTVLKDDPSLYKRYKNDNKIRFKNDNKIKMLFYEFLRDKLGG